MIDRQPGKQTERGSEEKLKPAPHNITEEPSDFSPYYHCSWPKRVRKRGGALINRRASQGTELVWKGGNRARGGGVARVGIRLETGLIRGRKREREEPPQPRIEISLKKGVNKRS